MKTNTVLMGAFLLIFMASCSPRVTTTVLRQYTPLPESADVALFEFGDFAPDSAEVIGAVTVENGGLATNIHYLQLVGLAKEEARKIGGNGLQIIDYPPSYSGNTYKSISATVLRLNDDYFYVPIDSLEDVALTGYCGINGIRSTGAKDIVSPYELSLNIGYGIITNRTKGIRGDEKKYEDALSNGFAWDAKFYRYYTSGFGWGLIYSGYTSSATYRGSMSELNGVKENLLLTFIAPMFAGKGRMDKWEFKYEVGIGYLGYRDKMTKSGYYGENRLVAHSVGVNAGFGVNYMVAEKIAIGFDLSSVAGGFNKIKNTTTGQTVEFDSGEGMGASRLNLLVGIRYCFGK